MHRLFDFFKGDPWLNILFLLLAVVGIILATIFYFKSLKEKKPVFSKQTFRLVNNTLSTINNIDIRYKNIQLRNLSLTKIAFWNAGKDPIISSDIASSDPLVIQTNKDTLIYDFEISHAKAVNNINVSRLNENSLNISFEFLNCNDGLVVTIYHNGKSSSDLSISGTIIGSNGISNGVKRDVFAQKADFLTKPINTLINHKNLFARIIGWLLVFPIGIFIIIPISLIILPLDFINDRIVNKTPGEFYFYDQ